MSFIICRECWEKKRHIFLKEATNRTWVNWDAISRIAGRCVICAEVGNHGLFAYRLVKDNWMTIKEEEEFNWEDPSYYLFKRQ